MAYTKVAIIFAVLAVAAARPEPPPPGPQNAYLPPNNLTPPVQQGYDYTPPPRPLTGAGAAVAPVYGPPKGDSSSLNAVATKHEDHDHHEPGMPFDFNYAVKDDEFGTDYSHNARSDGDVVTGEYRVQLPDGRLQIVRYTADWKNGYNAEVTYEGEPTYPEQGKTGAASNNKPFTGY